MIGNKTKPFSYHPQSHSLAGFGKSKKSGEDAGRGPMWRRSFRKCPLVGTGVTTFELDAAAEKMIRDAGAVPAFKGYHGFPSSICASVNEQVVHGFPSPNRLREGDVLSIDCGVILNGFVGDTAATIPVGRVDDDKLRLIRVAEECLELAIDQCRPGRHVGDIGWAVQRHAEASGYSVVREYVGHGIGRRMHEDPQIPNYGSPGKGAKIKAGYVFAVERVNMGSINESAERQMDGRPGGPAGRSAHVEHTAPSRGRAANMVTLVSKAPRAAGLSINHMPSGRWKPSWLCAIIAVCRPGIFAVDRGAMVGTRSEGRDERYALSKNGDIVRSFTQRRVP